MKKSLHFLARAAVVVAAVAFTACNADMEFVEPTNPETRSTVNPDGTTTITFDDFDDSMMAYTSRADNYYTYYGFTEANQVQTIYDPLYTFVSTMNTVVNDYGSYTEFSSGAIALSKYNSMSNPAQYPQDPTKPTPSDWWYSWENQCSVYNTASVDGANENAGHSGSNFAVVYGYSDKGNQDWMSKPEFYFDMPYTFKGLWYCNTAYTYGVIMNGNQFGTTGSATALKDQVNEKGEHIGYFQVMLECYNIDGGLITTKELVLADYRNGKNIDPVTTWTYWPIDVEGVQSVKFNFAGSDSDETFGLNTPAYICIDDITVQ